MICADGRVTIHVGDCRETLAALPEAAVDCIVTDPPYGLGFMGATWDGAVPPVAVWRAALRVLKPGGHLIAFSGTRTYHRMACAIEDAGFEVRDMLSWLYGSGFPKSLDVAKAIDKRRDDTEEILQVTAWIRGARDRAGIGNDAIDAAFGFRGMAGHWTSGASQPSVPTLEQWPRLLDVLGMDKTQVPSEIARLVFDLNGRKGEPGEAWKTAAVVGEHDRAAAAAVWRAEYQGGKIGADRAIRVPNSEHAEAWQGWGTALKPACEPAVLARKPLAEGTVAAQVLATGTGALNIDACRIEGEAWKPHLATGLATEKFFSRGEAAEIEKAPHALGRWPANVMHDGSPEVLALFPDSKATAQPTSASGGIWSKSTGKPAGPTHGDSGSAARFFYCAKASRSERGEGNTHPTVKPVALMQHLVRLVTPPGGLVLDPFAGSGTTGLAAAREGFRAILCELNPDYAAMARDRIAAEWREPVKPGPVDFGPLFQGAGE